MHLHVHLKKWTLHFKTVVSIEPLAIWIKFAGYVRWILVCKLCKFGEYICWNPTDIEFFPGVTFLADPVDCGDSCCLNHASLLEAHSTTVICWYCVYEWIRVGASDVSVSDVLVMCVKVSRWSVRDQQIRVSSAEASGCELVFCYVHTF